MAESFEIRQLNMIPFSRRLSRFMLYEEKKEDGLFPAGLYLHLTADMYKPGGVFVPGRKRGIIHLSPIRDGKELPYKLKATPSMLTMETEKGNIEFTIDRPEILRIRSCGVGLRAFSPLFRMEVPLRMNDGSLELFYSNLGNVLIRAIEGAADFNTVWRLKDWRADDVICDLTPSQNGIMEAAIHEFAATEAPLEKYRPFDLCEKEAADDFSLWQKKYKEPCGDRELFDMATYITWICMQRPRVDAPYRLLRGNMMYNNRFGIDYVNLFEQPLLAMAFEDRNAKAELIGNVLDLMSPDGMLPAFTNNKEPQYGYAAPPVIAIAAKETAGELQGPALSKLKKLAFWWLEWRDPDHDGTVSYAYAKETGFDAGLTIRDGLAVKSPDLLTYMCVLSELLSETDADSGAYWKEISRGMLGKLTDTLWDGEEFVCRRSKTYEKVMGTDFLGYIPVLLGSKLPGDIARKLTDAVSAKKAWERKDQVPLAAHLVKGFLELSQKERAEAAGKWFIGFVKEHGFVNKIGAVMYSSWSASAYLYITAALGI